jgi:hypothetical protein
MLSIRQYFAMNRLTHWTPPPGITHRVVLSPRNRQLSLLLYSPDGRAFEQPVTLPVNALMLHMIEMACERIMLEYRARDTQCLNEIIAREEARQAAISDKIKRAQRQAFDTYACVRRLNRGKY